MAKKGFTLLEILITLSILGVILSLLYLTFNQSMTAVAQIEERADIMEKGRLILERMSKELKNTFVPSLINFPSPYRFGLVAQSSQERNYYRDRVDFTSLMPPGREPLENTGIIQEIGYFLEYEAGERGFSLFRRQDDGLDGDLLRGGITQILCTGVRELSFVFFDRQGGQDKEWNSLQGVHQGTLPARVEIKLMLEDSQGRIYPLRTQVFLPLTKGAG